MSPDNLQKLPGSVLTYWIASDALVVASIALVVGLALYFFGTDEVVAGSISQADLWARLGIVAGIALLVYMAKAAYRLFYFSLFSFTVKANLISVNSGVLIRSHKSVQFEEAENADVVRGPLLMLFGLGNLRVFTASPAQLVIVRSKHGSRTIHKPDVDIVLPLAQAMSLQDRFNTAVNRVAVVQTL